MKKRIGYILVLSIFFIIVDQVLKAYVSSNMSLGTSHMLINGILDITLVHNTGAAFSLFTGSRLFLIIIGVVATIGIIFYLSRLDIIKDTEVFCYALLIGGIIGNLIDRIFHGYVIDFIGLKFGSFNFPIFNFADMCIVIGVIFIFITTLQEDLCKK